MTTAVAEPEVEKSQGTGYRWCEGCPRCQDSNAGFCKSRHSSSGGLHPVCRRCGHCVLRGSHADDISDLEKLDACIQEVKDGIS